MKSEALEKLPRKKLVPAPFTADQRTALRRMPAEGREAVLGARPEAEFGISPVLPAEAKEQIAAVIEEYRIRPPRGWILIKQVPAAERIGVILVPKAAEQPPEIGIVIAIGQGTIQNGQLVPPEVAIGDHITFPKYAGLPVTIAGEEFTQLREDEVLLIAARPGGRADVHREKKSEHEPPHRRGCICADCSGAELTADND